MSLDYGLVKQFANITNDSTPEKTDPDILIGTIQANGNVLLDGATSPTPAGTSTANYKTGDRVTCIIENHECKVIGNATAPSVQRAEDLADGSIPDEKLIEGVPRSKSIFRPPTEEDEGDEGELWFDVSNGNSIYIYTNGIWQPKILSGEAIIAPTGSKVWYTDTEPTEATNGDTWFKKLANGSYEQYEYSNNQWNAAELSGTSIKANSITSNEIAAGAITANEISSNYVYAGAIAASQISAGSISGCSFTTTKYSSASSSEGIYKALSYYLNDSRYQYWDESDVAPNQFYVCRYTSGGYPNTVESQATMLADRVKIQTGGSTAYIFADYAQINGARVLTSSNVGSYVSAGDIGAAYSVHGHNQYPLITGLSAGAYTLKGDLYYTGSGSNSYTCGHNSSHQITNYSSSSRRHKDSIRELSDAEKNEILKLYDVPVKAWRYKDGHINEDDPLYNKTVYGVIAEELEEAIPISAQYIDGQLDNYSDRILLNSTLYLVQDLNNRIKELEERLAKLEAR